MSAFGQRAPTDPVVAFAQRITQLEARVAELERTASRRVAWISIGAGGSAYGAGVANLAGFASRWRLVGDVVEVEFAVSVDAAARSTLFTLPHHPTSIQPRGVGEDFGLTQEYQRVNVTTAGAVDLVPSSPSAGNVFGRIEFSIT